MQRLKISKILLLFSVIVLYKTEFYRSRTNENETNFVGRVIKIKEYEYANYYEVKGKEKIIVIDKSKQKFEIGNKISIKGELKKPEENKVFNLFNYRNHLKSKKIYWILEAREIKVINNKKNPIEILKLKINNRIETLKSKDYIKALIIGEVDIEEETISTFRKNGTIHILSISGTHIALIILLLNKKRFTIPTLILYLFLTGFLVSLTRAVLFYFLIQANKLFNLNITNKDILELLALAFLIINPYLIHSTSFLFSFVISYFIIIKKFNKRNKIMDTLNVSIIAFFASLPILINSFFEFNPFTPIINMIFIPIFSLIIFPLSLLTFLFPIFDNLLFPIINLTENLSNNIATITPLLIHSKMSVIVVLIYYALMIKIKSIKKFTIVLSLILIITNLKIINTSRITIIDVDQGDSALIEVNGKVVLIDTGGKYGSYTLPKNRIIPYIKSLGYSKIDFMILTHGDSDHAKEALYILDNFKVENIILNCGVYNDLEKEIIKIANEKQIVHHSCINELNLSDYKMLFLNTKEYNDENNDSNVIYMEVNDYKFLFMGDAGIEKEKDIIKKYNLTKIDFLKIGHHGSNTSTSKEFIEIVKPKYSLISVGKNNRYGHPKKEILNTLKNSIIFRTDKNGSIQIEFKKNKFTIQTNNP